MKVAGGQLMRFARFADARGIQGALTLDVQLDWAREHVLKTSSITWARRLEIVRPFAIYYRQFEPTSIVPDGNTFGPGHRRLAPHIYTDQEIVELLQHAALLPPNGGLRPLTYNILFGLIASTGLRISEALSLLDTDVNIKDASLTIRQTKFNKSRYLPLHESTVQALSQYRLRRNLTIPTDPDMSFFVSNEGLPLSVRSVDYVFNQLRAHIGWVPRGDYPNPRIHDLRHTFAVRRVQQWHAQGVAVEHGMFWLCTYLGHAKISDTYWYLTGVPELMSLAGDRFARYVRGDSHRE
jgi:integrase